MSILLAAASTQATQPSSQASPSVPLTSSDWAIVFGCLVLTIVMAFGLRIFKRGSIRGPERLPDGIGPALMWLIALGGFVASILAQAICISAMNIHPESISLHETVLISCLGTAVGFGAIGLFHAMRDPLALDRLGFSLNKLRRGAIGGFAGALLAIPLVIAVTAVTQELWRVGGMAPPEEHILLKVFGESAVPTDKWLVIVSAVILAPLFEEMLFRGHVQTAVLAVFKRRQMQTDAVDVSTAESPSAGPRWVAIFVSASLFAAVHGVWWMMPPLFVLAVCLGYAYERTGNLWTTIIMHASFNATSIAMEYWAMRH